MTMENQYDYIGERQIPFVEVRNDYYEEAETPDGIGKRYIDAFFSDEDEDAGVSVATVDDDGNVSYRNGFKPNPEIHQNVLESIKEAKELAAAAKQELVDKCLSRMGVNPNELIRSRELLGHLSIRLLWNFLFGDLETN